jgi:hypothetical protein
MSNRINWGKANIRMSMKLNRFKNPKLRLPSTKAHTCENVGCTTLVTWDNHYCAYCVPLLTAISRIKNV